MTEGELTKISEAFFSHIDKKLADRFNHLEKRISEKFDGVTKRLDDIDERLDRVENRLDGFQRRLDRVERRIDRVDERINSVEVELVSLKESTDAQFADIHDIQDKVGALYDKEGIQDEKIKDHERRVLVLERS